MNKRNCPVCDGSEAEVIMRFTPELLFEMNPNYSFEVLKDAVRGKEEFLTYSKCRNCGMVYCENIWDDNTLGKVYVDAIDHAKSKDGILLINKRASLARIWTNILRTLKLSGKEKLGDLKIIDYGCGWGDFMDTANGYGVSVIGYDTDSKKTELAQERGHKIIEDIDELKSFGPVDVVVMFSVLEHLQDVKNSLNLVKELLKPEGLFVFSVMDYRSVYIKKNVNRLRKNLPALTKNFNPVEHVNLYSYKAVMRTVKKYNFDFLCSDNVLCLTDFYKMRNSMGAVRFFNWVEWLSTKVIVWAKLEMTSYVVNKE
jgi:2-polyprenyl-3-methyl-5-hydroxy-6-metoxy-1,4-benzoquinol methylase